MGMGFQDLEGFNLAMLGKQGWKLVSNPDALVSKIFKARYYPNGDFLNAKLRHNPSFTWRSIWSSKGLLAKGVYWKIGNGSNINVWRDPWLKDASNPYVSTAVIEELEELKVCEILAPNSLTWDYELLEELFLPRDVLEISNILLPKRGEVDTCIWAFTKDGFYSVKAGYKVIMEMASNNENLKMPGEWTKLWNLKLPPKIKTFLWRALRECLPTCTNLQQRGIAITTSCVHCERERENAFHLFLTCPFAVDCWKESNLFSLIDTSIDSVESFVSWLFQVLRQGSEAVSSKIAMVLWCIWRHRNDKLWRQTSNLARNAVQSALEFLYNWLDARNQHQQPSPSAPTLTAICAWEKPAYPTLKCNLDAALNQQDQTTGLGMILRDSSGKFVACRTSFSPGLYSPREAEAVCLYEAIDWIRVLGYRNVVFETDAKVVVDAVNSTKADNSEFGSMISSCRYLLSKDKSYSLCFAKRQVNKVAHALAKAACSYTSPSIWHDMPDFISNIVVSDCSNVSNE